MKWIAQARPRKCLQGLAQRKSRAPGRSCAAHGAGLVCWLSLGLLALPGCEPQATQFGDININARVQAADGLDLRAVGEAVKKVKSAEEFEQQLNQPGGVNNLDLNEDGKVDFIHVTEYGAEGAGARGFSLTVQPAVGETQEIATIEVEKPASEQQPAEVTVRGDPHVYGHGHHYQWQMPFASMLLASYLFRPHPFYVSPFHFGYYPSYYGVGYRAASPMRYASRTRAALSTVQAPQRVSAGSSKLQSPNAGKTASRGVRASLRNPTRSQRSFQARSRRASSSRGFARRAGNRAGRAAPAPRRAARPFRSRGFRRGGGFRSRR